MPLSNTKIKNLKPKDKSYKVTDEKGLFLLVNPTGSKLWRLKYRLDGKEKSLSIGKYPDIPLASQNVNGITIKGAREIRDEARQLISAGVDPSQHKIKQKNERLGGLKNSFESVSRDWFKFKGNDFTTDYLKESIRRFEQNLFPWLGKKTIIDIEASELLESLKRVEDRGATETAHRLLSHINKVYSYAISSGIATSNPAIHLKGAIKRNRSNHFATILEPDQIGGLLRAISGYKGDFVTKSALKFAPLVFVRSGELRNAKWQDVDFEKKQWCFKASKTHIDHIVPLSSQAIKILKDLYPLTQNSEYVFPSPRSLFKPLSENTLLGALRRMGFSKEEMTIHGFRAMARTLLEEELKYRYEYIEQQLAHTLRDPNGRAYNRTTHIAERTEMMQNWSDYLYQLKGE